MTLENLRHNPQLLIGILILFYAVGVLLFLIGETRALIGILTSWSLILTFGAVLLFQKKFSLKLVVAFMVVFATSLIIEVIGVNTGILFGNYEYGSALGPKILHTPVLIGLNWLILIYCSAAIVNHYFTRKSMRIIAGSLLMVVYDLILEYVAPVMDMWSWDAPYPGIRNFVMWFVVAMFLHLLFQWLDLRINNKPARYLFFIQFLFLCLIAFSSFLFSR
jgi:putative membrane protein